MNTENQNTEVTQLTVVADQQGLQPEAKLALQTSFQPFFEQANALKAKAFEIKVTDADQKDLIKQAREMRLMFKEIRLKSEKTRKALKEDSLRYGKAIDGTHNIIEFLVVPAEKHLEEQEKFAERQQAERDRKLQDYRESLLQPLVETPVSPTLWQMPQDTFDMLLAGAQAAKAKKDEEARKIAEAIEAKRKQEAEEQARIRKENEELKAKMEAERIERERLEAIRLAEQAKADAEAKRIKAEADAKLAAERAAKEAELKKAREAQEKAEAEARKIREENEAKERKRIADEAKAKAEADEKARKEAAAPDKAKLLAVLNVVANVTIPAMSTEEGSKVSKELKSILDQAVESIATLIKKL